MTSRESEKGILNKNRRVLLTVAGTGVAAFVLGKIFGPSVTLFSRDVVINDKEFTNFRLIETTKEVKLYDKQGSEIIIFEKDGTAQ